MFLYNHPMNPTPFQSEHDLQEMRALLSRLGPAAAIVDFEEKMQMSSVRANTCLWRQDGRLLAFACVDDYNNLCYETAPEAALDALEDEIVAWGVACQRRLNAARGEDGTLDFSCSPQDARRLALMQRCGFEQSAFTSLHYRLSLLQAPAPAPFPAGFSWRSVGPADTLADLVALHRAAFGTDQMTEEYRAAICGAPNYIPELDLLAVAPDGALAGFCICGFNEPGDTTGYTDPIGTHPRYQRLGLARALVTVGLGLLRQRGAQAAEVGTSSENIGMQKLAESLGFARVAETLWFAKPVGD